MDNSININLVDSGWDPLDGKMDPEMLSASAKRSIKNILKSYVGAFDPMSELIQNSLDAVDKRDDAIKAEGKPDTKFEKKLWLTINLADNSFTIVDNGVGFKEQEFKSFLAPSISFKDGKRSRGNKGVGATYIGYGFNHLEVATKGEEFQFSGEIKDGRNWVEDVEGKIARPKIKSKIIENEAFKSLERGSLFSLKFGGHLTRPKDLSWYQASTADQWLYLLLIKTPLGAIDLSNQNNTTFFLNVVDKDGVETSATGQALYRYPHQVINGSKNLLEIRLEQERVLQKGGDVSKVSKRFMNLNGIYEFFDCSQIKKLPTSKLEDSDRFVDEYKITAYGYFSYSTTVWDILNDDVAGLRKGFRVLKGGIQFANNSMVQGDLLIIPLTKSIGYQNQTHVIIHFQNADPDLGRKGFQPELKSLAESIAIGIVNYLKNWKSLLKIDKGNKPDITQEMNLHEWVKKEEAFEQTHPLSILNPNFFQPVNDISISSEPQTEQDTIVLFSQLLAGGVIRGLKLFSTSQNNQYDGLYKFSVTPPSSNHIYQAETNPLGVLPENFQENTVSKPRVLEYKYNMDALIYQFENNEKHERDVSLAVVWDIGSEWKRNYEVTSLLDVDNIHHRHFHGITHTFHTDSGGRFDAIVLKELVQYLNDPAASDILQKEKYGDNF
jgi:hypothetical protein